ncbi:hypothetical protein [Okeania sp. KiyG1]|uniref:hypothetical protein n=1 Tax=Okeania sp. KiyG1 TaxID=2720165 RepID=UPI00192218C5|nr:hypothetical protein [Okeania sp. KiyG1]
MSGFNDVLLDRVSLIRRNKNTILDSLENILNFPLFPTPILPTPVREICVCGALPNN